MTKRVIAGVFLVAAAIVVFVVWPRSSGQDDVLTDMESISLSVVSASTSPITDDFPAIEDSAVRDPDERTSPTGGTIEVLDQVAHDETAFTQGFEFLGERLFESTGLTGSSSLREIDPDTGEILQVVPVADVFAEGITVLDDEILQLTWTEQIAFRYDVDSFAPLGTYAYDGQGWGICDDDSRLVMSDGSANLTFRNRDTFAVESTVEVTFNGAPVQQLNELECVGSTVFANIWKSALIIEIDPTSGHVLTVFNASDLRPESTRANAQSVLNGIAYDAAADTFRLTGKNWPIMYEVRLHSAP